MVSSNHIILNCVPLHHNLSIMFKQVAKYYLKRIYTHPAQSLEKDISSEELLSAMAILQKGGQK